MSNDAIVLLREDHREVRRLFREYRGLAEGDGHGGDDARREVERIVEFRELREGARPVHHDEDLLEQLTADHRSVLVHLSELKGLPSGDP